MFPWVTVHVMNVYVDNVCISEDDKNIPKENVPPSLPLPYLKYILEWFLGLSSMPTPPILLLYLLMQFMRRNLIFKPYPYQH